MPRDDLNKTESARAGARRLIEQTPKAIAGLAALSGVAYRAGSFYTKAYFSEFGASWILEEVPTATYFSQSWVPLLLLLYLGYLATTNLAVIADQDDILETVQFQAADSVQALPGRSSVWAMVSDRALGDDPSPKHSRLCHIGYCSVHDRCGRNSALIEIGTRTARGAVHNSGRAH